MLYYSNILYDYIIVCVSLQLSILIFYQEL